MSDEIRNAILCDDIRQEKNNKYILIGVFSGDIVVQSFPATILVRLYSDYDAKDAGQKDFAFRYLLDGEQRAELKGRLDVDTPGIATIILPPVPLEFKHECELRVEISIQEAPPSTVVTKRVIKGEVAT